MKKFIIYFVILSSTIFATLTSPGDLSFVGFNADANDDFAIALFKKADENQIIEFCDEEWDGTNFGGGEAEIRWFPPAGGVSAGTVVIFNNVDSGTPSVSVGKVEGDAMGISSSGETIYSYLGTNRTPTVFLGIVSTKINDLNGTNGTLFGTGCSLISNTVNLLPAGIDCAEYEAARSGKTVFTNYLSLISSTNNWKIVVGGGGDQSTEILPFDTTPFSLVGASIPTNILKIVSSVVAVITSSPNASIELIVQSTLSSGVLSIGFGKEADSGDWLWTNTPINGAVSPYFSTNIISPSVPGNYYYGMRWTDGIYTYYGWNTKGQTNEAIMQGEYLIVVTNPTPPPSLIITEVMSSSSHPAGFANADWFEIYNPENFSVDISGWSCDDDSATPGVAVFPSNSVIGSKETLIVSDETACEEIAFIDAWNMQNHGDTNVINLGGDLSGLSSGGDGIFLFNDVDIEVTSATFGPATNGHSFAWDIYGEYLGISYEGVSAAWVADKNGTNNAPINSGTDIGSPGVVVPEPTLFLILIFGFLIVFSTKRNDVSL